jgi:anti-sigma factor RsiW
MHDAAIDELERHLSGNASSAFYAHLSVCEECRVEVAEMESLSAMFREFRADAQNAPEPRLGFYNRVAGEIIDHQRTDFRGLFAPGAAFFRRIAFASLVLLAGLGSYLVSHESSFAPVAGSDPATIMASHDPSVDHPAGSDRDRLLVTLATYSEQP